MERVATKSLNLKKYYHTYISIIIFYVNTLFSKSKIPGFYLY